ncbi:MAG: MarR family transcriptional regulator [Desulfobacula sp.]|nr:MarR family transcriptional regulator [Desulfobacula sp.]
MHETFAKESVGKKVNSLFRLCMIHLRNEMKKMGVGAGDYPFLAFLFFKEGQSQDELSKRMRVDKSYTARALAKLEKLGMIERRPDLNEHRVKRVFLSQKSRDMETPFFEMLKNWHNTLIKNIDPDDLAIVQSGMDQMIENAEDALGLEKINE